ncbi:hypothetical protein GCM10027416_08570 [Okibacterium endophyticum]
MSINWGRRLVASLLVGLVVSVLTHLVTMIVFLIAGQADVSTITQLSDYYAIGSVALFVLAFLTAFAGALTWRVTAFAAGILVGALAAGLATVMSALTSGTALTDEVWTQVLGTLIGFNTGYIFFTALLMLLLGYPLFRSMTASRERQASDRKVAIVRMPGSSLGARHRETVAVASGAAAADSDAAGDPVVDAAGSTDDSADGANAVTTSSDPVAEADASPVVTEGDDESSTDVNTRDAQWDAYVTAFEANGWETTQAPFVEALSDSVFVADAAVVLETTAVIGRFGSDERRGEVDGVEETLRRQGLAIERIMSPGTLECRDVLVLGTTVLVGRSALTNAEGVRQLRVIAAAEGYSVVVVPVSGGRHLQSVATALPDGTVLTAAGLLDDVSAFGRVIEVPEPEGVSVVPLAVDRVLISSSAPATAAMLEDRGYSVVQVDISEFEKLGGNVSALSVRIS